MEELIRKATQEALDALGASGVSFAVEWPADMAHGDYAVNAALAASKTLGKSPREIAEALAPSIKAALRTHAQLVEIAGPGFINITLSKEALDASVADATAEGWGKGATRAGSRVIFEYSCPNPFKEMHVGHLMNTVIGESVSRLIQNQGATLTRDTYGGDVGPHVAKALWALKDTSADTANDLAKAYVQGARAYEESDTTKQEIDSLNTALYVALAKDEQERSDEERTLLARWQEYRDMSYASHAKIWEFLGTKFDYIFHESEATPVGMRIVADGLASGVFKESEGAVIYDGEKVGLHTLVFITSRATPTYEAKDVGLAFLKEERVESDASYIMTGSEQVGHFRVFLAALGEIAPALARKTHHVPHGLLQLTSGKMSSRAGNVITAQDILEEVLAKATERNSDPLVAHDVAVGALKYMILRSAPGGNVVFDPEKSLSLEGDSGPYLQYALVRAKTILEKAAQPHEAVEGTASDTGNEVLARLIHRFPEVVRKAEVLHGPHILVQYLTQLAGEWNSYYAHERIIGAPDEAEKLQLARAFVATLGTGLTLLGIPTPEKM